MTTTTSLVSEQESIDDLCVEIFRDVEDCTVGNYTWCQIHMEL